MTHLRTLLLLAAILVFAGCDASTSLAPDTAPNAAPDVSSKAASAPSGAALAGSSYVILGKGNRLPNGLAAQVEAAGGTLTGTVDAIGVAFATSTDPNFGASLKGVQDVVPDAFIESPSLRTEAATPSVFNEVPSLDGAAANAGTDEPFYPFLWGVRTVDAPQAWDAGARGAGVVVAVLDEGFDLDHPDLALRGDLAASFTCWTVIDGGVFLSDDPADCEPVDYQFPDAFSHGMHVAGTVAASDNGLGVIGVAPDAEIMPVKVLSEILGGGASSWIIQGIVHATDNGADVINMSLGGTTYLGGKGSNLTARSLVAYRRAVNYAIKNGVTVITSAGNSSFDGDGNGDTNTDDDPTNDGSQWVRPAMFEGAISVSATGPVGFFADPLGADFDRPASYTNFGTSLVDFAAPGGDFQLFPGAGWFYDMVLSTGAAGGYYFSAGTSMAAPHVAGVAAVIIGESGKTLSPAQVEKELRHRAVDLGKPGNDDFYGQGRVSTGY
jgi:subtilisin family serine protease